MNLRLRVALAACLSLFAGAISSQPVGRSPSVKGEGLADAAKPAYSGIAQMASELAAELKSGCPFADAADETALKRCEMAIYNGSSFRRRLPEYVLWGRKLEETSSLKETVLTQFGPDILTATYIPLFMFNGEYEIRYDEKERLYRIEFVTAFRNRLAPGLFPYPFWHDENKWTTYQGANRITMWVGIDRRTNMEQIKAIQFSRLGKNHAAIPVPIPLPAFDKDTHAKWMWTDSAGKMQPKVTLFDGQYSAGNPQLNRLDETYRAVAVELRNSECLDCHVPNNPEKMRRLVLLQTPAHAASEIRRVIRNVREDRMPLDESGIEKPLSVEQKNALLAKAEAFQAAIIDAKAWESKNAKR